MPYTSANSTRHWLSDPGFHIRWLVSISKPLRWPNDSIWENDDFVVVQDPRGTRLMLSRPLHPKQILYKVVRDNTIYYPPLPTTDVVAHVSCHLTSILSTMSSATSPPSQFPYLCYATNITSCWRHPTEACQNPPKSNFYQKGIKMPFFVHFYLFVRCDFCMLFHNQSSIFTTQSPTQLHWLHSSAPQLGPPPAFRTWRPLKQVFTQFCSKTLFFCFLCKNSPKTPKFELETLCYIQTRALQPLFYPFFPRNPVNAVSLCKFAH